VTLPDSIDLKYTEEEAEYLSMRPVVRQTFRAAELVDMILRVAGKDLTRVQQILRSGTVVFHSFRYWWQGFETDAAGLRGILASYPDADPARAFHAEDCTEVILESSGSPARHTLRVTREEAGRRGFMRGLFGRPSFWDSLMKLARERDPKYREYSYALAGDVYEVVLASEQIAQLAEDATRRAARSLRADLSGVLGPLSISQVAFVCQRRS
jgi:hypothetical protein